MGVQTCALPICRQPGNAADAIATAKGLMRRGASFDAGLMQINSANFARLGLTPETVFDPCTNLRAGAHVLTDNYRRASDAGRADPLRAALSEYNSGSRTRGLTNGYVGRVYAAAKGTGAGPARREKTNRNSVGWGKGVSVRWSIGVRRSIKKKKK